jgi:aminoglycoside phosphotransferase family enzyme/predicted kinase
MTQSPAPALVADLLQPAAYPHPADDLRLYETHSSWVFLAGRYAYKVRKPVDLGFLDFTTPARRRADCEEELRLNRRLSPDIYLGIVEIVTADGHFKVGGPSGSGEPAVHMRRLPEDGMLPERLASGRVDARLARRIARQIAEFHGRAPTGPGVDEYGTPASIAANWDENFTQMQPFVGRTVDPAINAEIEAYVSDFLATQRPLLERRVAAGRIRDGHGDLHAASICLDRGRIYFFDSLQFATRFRCSDVAAEVSFLAMDFEHHGRADLAWSFVDAYVAASGDHELLALFDFYACYRAYVRGKVRSLRAAQPGQSAADEARIVAESAAYFDLAWAHATGFVGPRVIVSMGLPASGKTTLARGLSSRLGLVHLSSDVVRKDLAGIPSTRRTSDQFRTGLYSSEMTARTYTALRRRAAAWLKRGRGVVLDATYGDPAERDRVHRLGRRAGVEVQVLLSEADDATLRDRLVKRAAEPGVASDARLELWPALRAAFVVPGDDDRVRKVDARQPPTATLTAALERLRTPAPPARPAAR